MSECIFDKIYDNENFKPVAAEVFSAAWCNLDCRYCYIPKDSVIKKRHDQIIEEIKEVDPIIDRLKTLYGENLVSLSHWGSEPTLTIKYFDDFYKKAVKEFPNLKSVKLSSNFCTDTDNLYNFILNLPTDKKLDVVIQMSLDGPKWITDYNRRKGKTEVIVENINYLIHKLNNHDIYHNITMHFKPTWSIDNMKYMLENDKVEEYFTFFDEVISEMVKNNYNKQVKIIPNSCQPTIVCIDEYTTEDGKIFYEIYKRIQEIENKFKHIKPDISYYGAFDKLFNYTIEEFWIKQKMFTCSAGDSQFGVSNDDLLHLCHETFYFEYQDLMIEDDDRMSSGLERKNVENERIGNMYNNLPHIYNDKEVVDYYYVSRAYHDFVKHRIYLSTCMVKELAECGQVSECYKDWDMAEILAIFCIQRHGCFLSSMENFGSFMVYNFSYFRFFGNGVIEDFVRRWKNGRK